jgi:hypothetical protein
MSSRPRQASLTALFRVLIAPLDKNSFWAHNAGVTSAELLPAVVSAALRGAGTVAKSGGGSVLGRWARERAG